MQIYQVKRFYEFSHFSNCRANDRYVYEDDWREPVALQEFPRKSWLASDPNHVVSFRIPEPYMQPFQAHHAVYESLVWLLDPDESNHEIVVCTLSRNCDHCLLSIKTVVFFSRKKLSRAPDAVIFVHALFWIASPLTIPPDENQLTI